MSNRQNLLIKGLVTIVLLLSLVGCITTEVTINLNPDGSGTLVYTRDFDRASEPQKEEVRKELEGPYRVPDLTREAIEAAFPAPHFKIVEYAGDLDALRWRIVLEFEDVNALLVTRKISDLGLGMIDFQVIDESLEFSVKQTRSKSGWPKKFDEVPGQNRIQIVNNENGERIEFFQEVTSESAAPDWSERLEFPGHQIIRNPRLYLFRDYPQIQAAESIVQQARWSVSLHASALELSVGVPLPQDEYSYLYWDEPVLMNGQFMPLDKDDPVRVGLRGAGELTGPTADMELEFDFPAGAKTQLSGSEVRVKAIRSRNPQWVNLGPLVAESAYEVDGLVLKTDDLARDEVSFKLTGDVRRFKGVALETRRGNRFPLKRSSWSGGAELNLTYRPILPLGGTSLWVELYEPTSLCYLDFGVPAVDLTKRSWRADGKPPVNSEDWKMKVMAEHPGVFDVEAPAIGPKLFKEEEVFFAYFSSLKEDQIMPGILLVVDGLVQDMTQNGQIWLQHLPYKGSPDMQAYMKKNSEEVARQLFSIYKHTPEPLICLSSLFSNLQLKTYVQSLACAEINRGNARFVSECFFGKSLSLDEVEALKSIFYSQSWISQNEVIRILDAADRPCLDFAVEVATCKTLSPHSRNSALQIVVKDSTKGPDLLEKIALDESEDVMLRGCALQLMLRGEQVPFEAIALGLNAADCRDQTMSTVSGWIERSIETWSSDEAIAIREGLSRIVLIVEDLSEQLDERAAKEARKLNVLIQSLGEA